MRALVYERYGPPDNLRLQQVPRPKPGPGEVLVRVRAASVNSWDWDLLVGNPLTRISAPFRPAHNILGADIAGTVAALGSGVTTLAPGDAVFGDLSDGAWGGFAEFAIAKADVLAPIPDGLGFVEAAAIPQAGALALQGLRRRPHLGAGDVVLLNGAGGGVGTFALQLARRAGASVVAVDRAEKRASLLALGADAFLDYRETSYTDARDRYDLIVDVVANRPLRDYASALRDGGNLVVIGGRIGSLLRVAAWGRSAGRRRNQQLELLIYRVSASDNAELAGLCIAGHLRPIIDSVHPLERGADALRRLGSGLAIGKVVITLD